MEYLWSNIWHTLGVGYSKLCPFPRLYLLYFPHHPFPYFHMETTSCLLIASLINKSLIFRHMAAGLTVTFLASFGGRSGYEVMLRG